MRRRVLRRRRGCLRTRSGLRRRGRRPGRGCGRRGFTRRGRGRRRRRHRHLGQHHRRRIGRHGRVRIAVLHLDRQLLPLVDEFLLALLVVDGRNRGGDRLQLLLGLFPLPFVDQLLDLLELTGRQFDTDVTSHRRGPEDQPAHAVQRIAGARTCTRPHRSRRGTAPLRPSTPRVPSASAHGLVRSPCRAL